MGGPGWSIFAKMMGHRSAQDLAGVRFDRRLCEGRFDTLSFSFDCCLQCGQDESYVRRGRAKWRSG